MTKYDIVIVGAGLGGLLCANILCKEGFSVCIVEQNKRIGGSIQSFSKDKTIFNTGLNHTESLGEGQILNRYFKFFGIMDRLKCRRMDTDNFEKILFHGDPNEYPFAQGHENFVDSLSAYFPSERENLTRYINRMKDICDSFPLYSLDGDLSRNPDLDSLTTNTYTYLKSVTDNPRLQTILAGMNSLYAGVKNRTPLYVHALINSSFIKSAWRLVDGSSQLAALNASEIKKHGGELRTNCKVVLFGGEKNVLEFVELESGERIYADKIISNLHPVTTLNLVQENLTKQAFRARMNSLENTLGMFCIYMVLKPESFYYRNFNYHYFTENNAWTAENAIKGKPEHYMLYTPAISKSETWASGMIAITYMDFKEVLKWKGTTLENRGADYLAFKRQKAEQLITLIEEKFPDLRSHIQKYYASTPLTYVDYTGTPEGSAYGILKDYRDPMSTIVSPKSRVKNLYFTGQNLNMHGILGVTIGSILTCSEFVGQEYLVKKIKEVS